MNKQTTLMMLMIAALVKLQALAAEPPNPAPPALVKPTPEQVTWQDLELGMFIHWDVPWNHRDYENKPKPDVFNPTQLNTDQWMEAAKSFGAKYCVLTATHGTGFMLWQSDAYPFGMKQSPYKNGKCDVVKEYVDSCRKAGISPGLYCHMKVNGWWEVDHPGLVNRGGGGDPKRQADYAKAKLKQAAELWGNYGPLAEIWFDGGLPDPKVAGFDVMPVALKLQPKAMLMGGSHRSAQQIRCVSKETGSVTYPCWATADFVTSDQSGGDPNGKDYIPGEADVNLLAGEWMWQPGSDGRIRSLDELVKMYYASVGHNCNLLVSTAPGPEGLISEGQIRRLRGFGSEIQRRFGKSLAETSGRGNGVELDLTKPTLINHVILMEQIAEGERIREYVIEGMADGEWKELAKGTCVGHKRIQPFSDVTVSKIRLRVTSSIAEPIIRQLSVYHVTPRPE